jgi:hypothetical protein
MRYFYIYRPSKIVMTRFNACRENRNALLPTNISFQDLAISTNELSRAYLLQNYMRQDYVLLTDKGNQRLPIIIFVRADMRPTIPQLTRQLQRMQEVRETIEFIMMAPDQTPEQVRERLGEATINFILISIEYLNSKTTLTTL